MLDVAVCTSARKREVNAEYCIENVLKRYLEVEVPNLYPNELSKVTFHHNKASSDTACKTTLYLQELNSRTGINFICKDFTLVKSPDISPIWTSFWIWVP